MQKGRDCFVGIESLSGAGCYMMDVCEIEWMWVDVCECAWVWLDTYVPLACLHWTSAEWSPSSVSGTPWECSRGVPGWCTGWSRARPCSTCRSAVHSSHKWMPRCLNTHTHYSNIAYFSFKNWYLNDQCWGIEENFSFEKIWSAFFLFFSLISTSDLFTPYALKLTFSSFLNLSSSLH